MHCTCASTASESFDWVEASPVNSAGGLRKIVALLETRRRLVSTAGRLRGRAFYSQVENGEISAVGSLLVGQCRSSRRIGRILSSPSFGGGNKRCHERPSERVPKPPPERSEPLFKRAWMVPTGRWVPVKIVDNIYPLTALMGCFRASWPRWNQVATRFHISYPVDAP